MQITSTDIITVLSIISLAMVIVLLYHLIFVSVNLRRMLERWDEVSRNVEGLILKPVGAIEFVLDWVMAVVEGMSEEKEHKHGKHHK